MLTTGFEHLSAAPHPPAARLAAFGLGKLDADEASSVADHVAGCDACRVLVESAADDSLAAFLRAADAPAAEPAAGPVAGYDLLGLLGEGGMGVVYRARQRGLGRVVALKQIRPEALAGRDSVARFRREAAAAARLRHPNIVPIYDVGRLGGLPYYAMELVEGGSLAERLAAGPVEPGEAAGLVERLALAVDHAHAAGVVHRDLKPANVLLAPDLASPKIADFGLAKGVGAGSDADDSRTRTGAILGTPGYMAPEQATGDSSRVGPSADVYALGAILYEALCGRRPFAAPTPLETLAMVARDDPARPRRVRRGVPLDLETVALKCLEKDPAKRYATARDLADDLRRYREGEPVRARRISAAGRLAKWARRRPWQAASAAIAAASAAALVAGVVAHNAALRAEVARTNQKAAEARDQSARADAQYRAARAAIVRILREFDAPMPPGLAVPFELRKRQVEEALTFYEAAVRDDAPAEYGARRDKVEALNEAATYQMMMDRFDDAGRTFRRVEAMLDGLDAERPGDTELARSRVNTLQHLGAIHARLGRLGEALPCFDRAAGIAGRLFREHPGSLVDGDQLAWVEHSLGVAYLDAGRGVEAEPHFARAAEVRERLLRDHPGQTPLRARLAESLNDLGLIHGGLGRPADAEAELGRAADQIREAARARVIWPESGISLGEIFLNWGNLPLNNGRLDEAVARYDEGLAVVEPLIAEMPDRPRARSTGMKLHGSRGHAFDALGRIDESVAAWERALALASGDERRLCQLGLCKVLARTPDADRAVRLALDVVADGPPLPKRELYDLACVVTLASARDEAAGLTRAARANADRALAWLRECAADGFFREPEWSTLLDDDPDLAPLRPLDAFRLLKLDAALPADPFARPAEPR